MLFRNLYFVFSAPFVIIENPFIYSISVGLMSDSDFMHIRGRLQLYITPIIFASSKVSCAFKQKIQIKWTEIYACGVTFSFNITLKSFQESKCNDLSLLKTLLKKSMESISIWSTQSRENICPFFRKQCEVQTVTGCWYTPQGLVRHALVSCSVFTLCLFKLSDSRDYPRRQTFEKLQIGQE